MSAADKIAEANGPERIWAHGNCMGRLGRPLLPGVSSHWATWETRTGDPNHATEYVRADLADAQAQEIERLTEALGRIVEWSEAYPLDVFQEPDFEKVRSVLEASGMTLDAVSASNMRHVLKGAGAIARAALGDAP